MSPTISTRWALRHVFDIENLRGCSAHSSALRGLRYVRLPLIPCLHRFVPPYLNIWFFQDNASMTIPFPMVWQKKNTRSSYHPFFSGLDTGISSLLLRTYLFPGLFYFRPIFFHCRKKRWCDEKNGIGRLKRVKTNFGHCVSMVFQWEIPESEGGKKKMCVKSCANYRSSSRSKNFTQQWEGKE